MVQPIVQPIVLTRIALLNHLPVGTTAPVRTAPSPVPASFSSPGERRVTRPVTAAPGDVAGFPPPRAGQRDGMNATPGVV